jgi:poly(hydroxyalkanoate) depolymerase family esterase
MTPLTTVGTHQRYRLGLFVPLAAVLVMVAALVTGQQPASAQASLTQVASFGSNPGDLAMYSYVPDGLPAGAPLVVALHGCTQNAWDYYSQSGWKKYADLWHFALVLPQENNSTESGPLCFNYLASSDDSRGKGEAESILQMVQYAQANYHVDASRIYITGLSAGGAMTSDLLADYPDVFAGGAIDSGLPAGCTDSQKAATGCVNMTPDQWGMLAKDADPAWHGPWPRVAIWQGTADTTVNPVFATEEMDQWTDVWGIGQTPSSTKTLTGGTTENVYNDASGKPAVEMYTIPGMGHGLAVNPPASSGSATIDQCGTAPPAPFFITSICSSYYTAVFWGLNP